MTDACKTELGEQELSESQWQCIEHLIAGKTKTAAAEAVGVARYTVSRWFQDAAFVAALNARRLDVQEANVERLRSLTERALAVLEGTLDDPNPKVRLQAATQILQAAKLAALLPPSTLTKPDEVEEKWRADEENRKLGRLSELIAKAYPQGVEDSMGAKDTPEVQRN